MVRAEPWSCVVKRVWARPRCLIIWRTTHRDAEWYEPRGASQKWTWRSRIASVVRLLAGRPWATAGTAARCTANRVRDGLAVLNLLSDAAEPQPLICVVDDEQWLDRASAQVLGFVARRLVAESVGMVFAARATSTDIARVSALTVEGLSESDARALLDSVLTGPLDSKVRDRILAGTNGNPLALLELPRALSSTT